MNILLETQNLSIEYHGINNNNNNKNSNIVKAVKNINLKILEGEIYALAGESGCGKSTLAKSIVKLVAPKEGKIIFNEKNILEHTKKDTRLYPQQVQMIFQNPYSSLNPRLKIEATLQEPLDINTTFSKKEKKEIILETLSDVGLKPDCLSLYPHEFSGGQRQRIAIARALILKPKLLIADEPVSALDASIQAQIINLLKELKFKHNLTILFISHDMNVIKYLADRVGIMHFGELIEENYTGTLFRYPKEEYTKKLLYSVPNLKH